MTFLCRKHASMRWLFMRIMSLVVLCLLLVCPRPSFAFPDAADVFVEAMLNADVETLGKILAPNFLYIGSNGHIQDKEHFLDSVRNKHLVVKGMALKNERETSLGSVRVITGNGFFAAASSTTIATGLMRFSFVSEKGELGESIVLVQLTPVIASPDCVDGNCLIR